MTPAKKTAADPVKVWECSVHGEFTADDRVCPQTHDRAYHVMDRGWKPPEDVKAAPADA